jgi:hypothetical protein
MPSYEMCCHESRFSKHRKRINGSATKNLVKITDKKL